MKSKANVYAQTCAIVAVSGGPVWNESETHPERAVPATRAKRHAVGANSQATDTILVTGKHSHPLAFQRIPDVTSPIIITTKEYTAGN